MMLGVISWSLLQYTYVVGPIGSSVQNGGNAVVGTRERHRHTVDPKCNYRIHRIEMHSHGQRLHRSHARITAVTSMSYNVQSMLVTINPKMPPSPHCTVLKYYLASQHFTWP